VPTGFDLVLVSFALHTNTHPFAQSRQLFGAPEIFEFSSCPTYCKRSSHRQLVNSVLPYKISLPSLWVMVMCSNDRSATKMFEILPKQVSIRLGKHVIMAPKEELCL
jgi:hypothetical protein